MGDVGGEKGGGSGNAQGKSITIKASTGVNQDSNQSQRDVSVGGSSGVKPGTGGNKDGWSSSSVSENLKDVRLSFSNVASPPVHKVVKRSQLEVSASAFPSDQSSGSGSGMESQTVDVIRGKFYANENCLLGVYSPTNDEMFVDIDNMVDQTSGATSRESFAVLRARGAIGSVQNLTVTLANQDHSVIKTVLIEAEIVPSRTTLLSQIVLPPGVYLEPEFSPYQTSYKIRVPDNKKTLSFSFLSQNDRDGAVRLSTSSEESDAANSGSSNPNSDKPVYPSAAKLKLKLPSRKPSTCDSNSNSKSDDGSQDEKNCAEPDTGASAEPEYIFLDSLSADRSTTTRYAFQIVPQIGGDTRLAKLEVANAPLTRPFNPSLHGPYTADLIAGDRSAVAATGAPWTQIKVQPKSLSASSRVYVDGVPLGTNGESQYLHVPRGQKRSVTIASVNEKNPVPEIYTVTLSRYTGKTAPTATLNADGTFSPSSLSSSTDGSRKGNGFSPKVLLPTWSFESAGETAHSASWLGSLTTILSSATASDLLANTHLLQTLSSLGHTSALSEKFDDFLHGFHPFNLRSNSLTDRTPLTSAALQDLTFDAGASSTGYHNSIDFNATAAAFAAANGASLFSTNGLTNSNDLNDLNANWFSDLSPDVTASLLSDIRSRWNNRRKGDSSSGAEFPEDMETMPSPHSGAVAGRRWLEATSESELGASLVPLPPRSQQTTSGYRWVYDQNNFVLSPETQALLSQSAKMSENIRLFASTLVVFGLLFVAVLSLYGLLYAAVVRRPRLSSSSSNSSSYNSYPNTTTNTSVSASASASASNASMNKTGGTGGNNGGALSQQGTSMENGSDSMTNVAPACLRPQRFLTFLFDIAFIPFVSASTFLLFNRKFIPAYGVSFFSNQLTLSPSALTLLSAGALSICLLYVAFGTLTLLTVSDSLVRSFQFQQFHDATLTHAKAIVPPKTFSNIPWLNRLLRLEITNVLPLKSRTENFLSFFDASENDGADIHNTTHSRTHSKLGGSQASGHSLTSKPEYNAKLNAVKAYVNESVYNDAELNYDGKNAALFKSYPEGVVGVSSFKIENSYGFTLDMKSEIQVQHLTGLMQLMDQFSLWIPLANCDFVCADRWRNLLLPGRQGFYYAWSLNRMITLMTFTFVAYTQNGPAALLALGAFCFLSFLSKVFVAAAAAEGRRGREDELQALARPKMEAAKKEASRADLIWPFNQPGFIARLFQIRAIRASQRYLGLGRFLPNPDQAIDGRPPTPASLFPYLLEEVVLTSVTSDLLCALIALFCYTNSPSPSTSTSGSNINGSGSMIPIYMAVAALLFANVKSVRSMLKMVKECQREGLDLAVESSRRLYAFFCAGFLAERLAFYAEQTSIALGMGGSETAAGASERAAYMAFTPTARQERVVPVEQVDIVSTELGSHFPCEVSGLSNEFQRVLDSRRTQMHKTLVVAGHVGARRKMLERKLPVQVPFSKLFVNHTSPTLNTEQAYRRLVATIQIVNNNVRYAKAGFATDSSDKHDSFLSLYAEDRLLPPPGQLSLLASGHNHSVRRVGNELVVRGPAILTGRDYALKTRHHQPSREQELVESTYPQINPQSNSQPGTHNQSQTSHMQVMTKTGGKTGGKEAASTQSLRTSLAGECLIPGRLNLVCPSDRVPNLSFEVAIVCPDGSQQTIDPNVVKVELETEEVRGRQGRQGAVSRVSHTLILRSQYLIPTQAAYTVVYTALPQGGLTPIDLRASSVQDGVAVFRLRESDTAPDMTSWMTLRDTATDAVTDIDPTQTDAYTFSLPDEASGSGSNFATRALSHLASLTNYVTGRCQPDHSFCFTDELIPCTLVQCVNPIEKIYRVDPNFLELQKSFNARIQELRAAMFACENLEVLQNLWPSFLSEAEYAAIWRENGISCREPSKSKSSHNREGNHIHDGDAEMSKSGLENEETYGLFVDPLRHSHDLKAMARGEVAVRKIVKQRIEAKIHELQSKNDQARIWNKGYNDSSLFRSQLACDVSDWAQTRGASEVLAKDAAQLQELKASYEAVCPGFRYPCNIPQPLIAKRARLSAQNRVWKDVVEKWLREEEGAADEDTVQRFSRDILSSITCCLARSENPSRNLYKSVLHYVIGGQSLRGMDTKWRPDPMSAHPALVRIWSDAPSKGVNEADFESYPSWFPCLLKLTPHSLKLLLPNADDLQRQTPFDGEGHGNGDAMKDGMGDSVMEYPWECSTGLYIPLACFQGFHLQRDAPLAPNEQGNSFLASMTCKLTGYKNQNLVNFSNLPDSYARRTEDNVIGNEICFSDGSEEANCFRVMLGQTLPVEAAQKLHSTQPLVFSRDRATATTNHFSIRFNPAFADQWARTVAACSLTEPHTMPLIEPSTTPTDPPTKLPSVRPEPQPEPELESEEETASQTSDSSSSSSSSSSSTSSSSDSLLEDLPAPIHRLPTPEPEPEPELEVMPEPSLSASSSTGVSLLSNAEGVTLLRAQFAPSGSLAVEGGEVGESADLLSRGASPSGVCCLRDEAGRLVFEGRMQDGRREGNGHAVFVAQDGISWQWTGSFSDNEICGPGTLSLSDNTQRADAGASKWAVVGFTGTILAPSASATHTHTPKNARGLTASDYSVVLSKKRSAFAANNSVLGLEAGTLIEKLARSLYVRSDGNFQSLVVDRFAYSDIVVNRQVISQALMRADAQEDITTRFCYSLLPHLFLWQDANVLSRTALNANANTRQSASANDSSLSCFRYADGAVWQGAVEPASSGSPGCLQPVGRGVFLHWPSGIKMRTTFARGLPHHTGDITEGGSVMEVETKEDIVDAAYFGGFADGRKSGNATLMCQNGGIRMATVFADDKPADGQKVAIQLDDRCAQELNFVTFEGSLLAGLPHGPGSLRLPNGMTFEGTFDAGVAEGPGKLLEASSTSAAASDSPAVFEGTFKKNLPSGQCDALRADNDCVFVGSLANGQRSGFGVLRTRKDKRVIYEGLWMNDLPHGRGVLHAADGEYEGEWLQGKRHGKGRFQFKENPLPNGKMRFYEGDWREDLPHGVGRYLTEDSAQNVYRFEKGEIVVASAEAYAPTCGKAPQVKHKPTVLPSPFGPAKGVAEDKPWQAMQRLDLRQFSAYVMEALRLLDFHTNVLNDSTLIDPSKAIALPTFKSSNQTPVYTAPASPSSRSPNASRR